MRGGLCDSSGQLGRRLTIHPAAQTWGRFDAPGQPLTKLNEEQLNDMAYHGFTAVSITDSGEYLELGGVTCFGVIEVSAFLAAVYPPSAT